MRHDSDGFGTQAMLRKGARRGWAEIARACRRFAPAALCLN